MENTVYILSLVFDISFDDADEGECYAGEGRRIISVHGDKKIADTIANEFNPVFFASEKESIVFPIQKADSILKERFGFTTHDISSGHNYKLVVDAFELESCLAK
jgi:hypothetical protein